MCSDRARVCGEIERGCVGGEKKRGRDRVCADCRMIEMCL